MGERRDDVNRAVCGLGSSGGPGSDRKNDHVPAVNLVLPMVITAGH
jgi:hypothetical protein